MTYKEASANLLQGKWARREAWSPSCEGICFDEKGALVLLYRGTENRLTLPVTLNNIDLEADDWITFDPPEIRTSEQILLDALEHIEEIMDSSIVPSLEGKIWHIKNIVNENLQKYHEAKAKEKESR
jgi:hypothetical protein